MPLPDERPRQSVANLIGRFEQQTKRSSLPNATTPLLPKGPATTLSPDHIGTSSKDDHGKEKREWPPKAPASSPPASLPSSPPPSSFRQPIASNDAPKPVVNASIKSDTSTTSPSPKSPNTTEPIHSDPPALKVAAKGPVPKPATTTSRSTSGKAAETPKKPGTKPAAPTGHSNPGTSATSPIKAQHTGQSSHSTPARKPPVSKSAPSASKPPARARTPMSIRPKTPSHTTHPKTPSSGLYAPTASSIARAKAGSAASPPPMKKAASSVSADRLSKPTASSISKARSSMTSPPLTSSRASTKTPTPRPSAAQQRTPTKPRHSSSTKSKQEKPSPSAPVAAAPAIAAGAATSEKDHSSDDEGLFAQRGSPSRDAVEKSGPLSLGLLDATDAGHASEAVDQLETVDSHREDTAQSPSRDGHEAQETSAEGGAVLTQSEGHESDTTLSDEVSEPQSFDQKHSRDITLPASSAPEITKSNNDLEDIVNLLEARPRPVSMMSIPDEE